MGVEIVQLRSFKAPAADRYSSSSGAASSTATTESGGGAAPQLLPTTVVLSWRVPAAAVDVPTVGDEAAVTSRPAAAAQQSSSSSSSRYKGVVPQPNGRWGAQIYERHARVWLGTFPDEEAAARAYDVAALRYRGRDAATNFPDAGAGPSAAAELAFLAAHSKSEIVDMLRKHTYADELRQGLRRGRGMGARAQPTPSWAREPLFEKAVTPSDVGKLNRLVVPKQHAEKHFPLRRSPEKKKTTTTTTTTGNKGVLLNFEDGEGKVWRFRYSYWNSSQSYVLTKGWSRFVREKGLGAGDAIVFSCSAYGAEKQLFIDCKKTKIAKSTAASRTPNGACSSSSPPPPPHKSKQEPHVVRLFGVDIAGDGAQLKRCLPPPPPPAAEQDLLVSKRQCLAAHHHSPALGAFVL